MVPPVRFAPRPLGVRGSHVAVALVSYMLLTCSTAWGLPAGALGRLGYGRPEDVRFSPDGRLLAVATSIGIELWDTATQKRVEFFETGAWMKSVAFSADGRTIAAAGRVAKVWDLDARQEVATLRYRFGFSSVALSPDGTTLATGSSSAVIKLWDIATQQEIAGMKPLRKSDEDVGARGSRQTGIVRRAVRSVARRFLGEGEARYVNAFEPVAFSPDGLMLASGSPRDGVRLWDVPGRRQIAELASCSSVVDPKNWARIRASLPRRRSFRHDRRTR